MIITRLSGAMGNQMFQYALGRFLAIKYNTELKLDVSVLNDRTPRKGATYRNLQIDAFNIQADIAQRRDIPVLYRQYFKDKLKVFIDSMRHRFLPNKGKEKNTLLFQPAVLSIGKNAYLDGHWSNEKYFLEIRNILLDDFTLKNPLPENSQKLLNEIQNTNSLCVHVRRTDFIGNDFHGVLGIDYYNQAFKYITNLKKIDTVYVFSDDLDWCKNNLKFPFETMFVGSEYAGISDTGHLMLMSACKNFIIPNSSFAWWAAWLSQNNNKVVVAPKRWFFDKKIVVDDVVPANWVRL